MIAACPRCKTRYRMGPECSEPQGTRVRCTRCGCVFRVRAAGAEPAAEPEPRRAEALDPRRLVLVADPDPRRAKVTCEALAHAGLQTLVVHDGVEALLSLQRNTPRAVVADAAMPRMFGFELCEVVKRNEILRSTWIVLVGGVEDPLAIRRPPSEPYGPDAWVERSELPRALLAVLRGFGLSLREPQPSARAAGGAAPGVRPAGPPGAARSPAPRAASSAGPAAADPGLETERAKAERLARIIVSDIVLYNQEKFATALRGGNVLEGMADELEEGRGLLRQRVSDAVSRERDFVADEMLRVARSRGAA